jgi:Flp pilus assembly protein TadG
MRSDIVQCKPGPRRGVAVVEMALVLPFLLIVLVGIWEVGRLIQVQQVMNNAAREGARLAAQGLVINKDSAATEIHVATGDPCVESVVRNYLREAGYDTTGLTVTFAYLDGTTTNTEPHQASKGQRFRVRVQLPFNNVRWTLLSLTSISQLNSEVEWRSLVDDPFTLDTNLPTW